MEKFCQSCGMPMKKDPNLGGTEKDGSKSDMYCSYCYEKGEFKDDFKTPEEMRTFVINLMVNDFKMPKMVAKLFTMNIKKLKRWQKK
jgi:hypothetical protein